MKVNFSSAFLGEAIVYRSESESRLGMFHFTFKLRYGGIVCTCEGWQFQGHCKHATNLQLDSPEAQRIQRRWRGADKEETEFEQHQHEGY